MNRVLVVVAVVSLLVGCSRVGAEPTEATEESDSSVEDCVTLAEIQPPKFTEDFATLVLKDNSVVIYWGIGDGAVMWGVSGYPGFDYPMVVSVESLPTDNQLSLVVNWGVYRYTRITSGSAFKENGYLYSISTGEKVVDYARCVEYLVLWKQESGEFVVYQKTGGTKIIE